MDFNALIPELAVSNLTASLSFYRDILGFAVVYAREPEGFAFLQLGSAHVMLDQIGLGRTWQTAALERPLGRGMNLQIIVPDLKDLLERLSLAGVPLFLPPESRSYEVDGNTLIQSQFCVQDPDGYLLRFVQLEK